MGGIPVLLIIAGLIIMNQPFQLYPLLQNIHILKYSRIFQQRILEE